MVAGVKRAYFYDKAKKLVYVELLEEDILLGKGATYGRLNYSMHGTNMHEHTHDARVRWDAWAQNAIESRHQPARA